MITPFQLTSGSKTLSLGARSCIMGILNVTSDSFYDGGKFSDETTALRHAEQLLSDGADILDIGGQSTRPGALPVGTEEELRRILPILKKLRNKTSAWISSDTYRAEVARICLDEGADLINDVSSFRMDPNMPELIAEKRVPMVCMHFKDTIHPMPSEPEYNDLFAEILQFFRETLRVASQAGIPNDQIIIDPGIGFGKKLEHNLQIIRHLDFLHELKRPILVGPSRKSFIGKITGLPSDLRLEGTAAAAGVCRERGAHIFRVHDVAFFRRYFDVLDEILTD